MKVMTIAVMVLRIAVLVALVLGIIFWTGNLENLQLLCWNHHRYRHTDDARARAA